MNAIARLNEPELILSSFNVDPARLMEVATRARDSGEPVEDILLRGREISKLDWLEVRVKRAGSKLIEAQTINHLPDADVLVYSSSTEQPELVVVAQRGDERKRAFIVHTGQPDQHALRNGITTASRAGHNVVGQVVASASLISLYVSQLNNTGKRQGVDGDGSDLIEEFFQIAHEAYKRNASDIHLSVERGRGQVQFREDGDLHVYRDFTEDHLRRMVRAIYNTKHEEGSTREDFDPRLLQNAMISHDYPDVRLRFRYSGLPLVSDSGDGGFDTTLRIIPVGQALRHQNPGDLGYAPSHLDILGRAFSRSSGIILFTGITGSGKSTSLAAFLSMLGEMQPNKKIRSVEEPIEYIIPGVKQTPADRGNLNDVLRQILRSDPDRVMVGEIRDIETATLAINATRTGHMVASTLHTDSAPTAYSRLTGMGVSPADLSSNGLISAVVYQALVKTLCPHCRIPAEDWAAMNPDDPVIARLQKPRVFGNGLAGVFFQNSSGCSHCKAGRKGRTVCAEVLRPTQDMMRAIANSDSLEIYKAWRSTINYEDPSDMSGRTAFEHALYKMSLGIVSPHEVETAFRWVDESPVDGEN